MSGPQIPGPAVPDEVAPSSPAAGPGSSHPSHPSDPSQPPEPIQLLRVWNWTRDNGIKVRLTLSVDGAVEPETVARIQELLDQLSLELPPVT